MPPVCRRYQRHRRQILPPVPLVLLTPVAYLPPVSTIPAANLPPVSTTLVANCHRYQRHRRQICQPVSLTPVAKNGNNIRLQEPERDSVTRFFASGFFHESVSPQPQSISLRRFEFFRKFAEVFEAQGLPPVSTTPVANRKNLQSEKFQ